MKTVLLALLACCTFTSFIAPPEPKKFTGTFTNGMKGAKFSFVLTPDGKKVQDVTFEGYWRCDGKLDLTIAGPTGQKGFLVINGKINGVIMEPKNGGATAVRFEMHGMINGNEASGTYRMNLNALGCDTYKLNWTATAE